MTSFRNLFRSKDRVCPWWLAWTFDNPLRRFLHDPERIFGTFLREGMTVSDIGCGMGYFTIAMAKMVGNGGTVLAVDLQKRMLDFTWKRAEKAGVTDRVRLLPANEDDIMIKDRVDFILAFWMVHEVRNIPRFFEQVYAVLKEGGKVLYAEPLFHVTVRQFQESLGYARAAGFRISDAPHVGLSHAALLTKEVLS